MRPLALAAALLFAASSHAQTTWANLHWGQPREQVRSQLSALGIQTETNAEGTLQTVADYELTLPGMRHAFPLHGDFHFTTDNHLSDVVLTLDVNAMRQNFSFVGNDEAVLLFAARRLARALDDKYGPVLAQSDDCTADPATFTKRAGSCELNLHTPFQSIELDWNTRPPHLSIRYQMLSPDL